MGSVRDTPPRSSILLNRCITRAHSTTDAREVLEGLGYDVLGTAVPRLEVYAQSFGVPIRQHGLDIWRQVAHDLVERCMPRCTVRSLARRTRPTAITARPPGTPASAADGTLTTATPRRTWS